MKQTRLILLGCLLGWSTAPATANDSLLPVGSVWTVVTNAAGFPQMGATIWLYNARSELVAQGVTDARGLFIFERLRPGNYSLQVRLASFSPVFKRGIQVEPGKRTLLLVSLGTVLSSIELVRTVPNAGVSMSDDWKWVLRTASLARPVLRFMPADPAKVTEPSRAGATVSKTRGLVKISVGDGGLGSAGSGTDLGTAFAFATTVFRSHRLEIGGTVNYGAANRVPSAGFRTSLVGAQEGEEVREVSLTMRQAFLPGRVGTAWVTGAVDQTPGLRTVTVAAIDRRQLAEDLKLEYGAALESVTFLESLHYNSLFARLSRSFGAGTVQLAYSSGVPPVGLVVDGAESATERGGLDEDLAALSVFPRVSVRDGRVRLQRSRAVEVAYRRAQGGREVSVVGFRESIHQAAVLVMGDLQGLPSSEFLPDVGSRGAVYNLGDRQLTGYGVSVRQRVAGDWSVAIAVGRADLLSLASSKPSGSFSDTGGLRHLLKATPRGWVAVEAQGTLPRTGTRVLAHWGWAGQGVLLLDRVYLTGGLQPLSGLNLKVRQPLPAVGFGPARLEAAAELRNLLAHGYLPVTSLDGRKLCLVQQPRSVRGGLSLIF